MKKRTGTKIMALTGPFAVYEPYATEIVQTIGRQLFPMSDFGFDDEDEDAPAGVQPNAKPEAVGNKIALMRFSGPMTKEDTCASWMLGGFSTMAAAKQIQMVADSGEFAGIAIVWYTPGGQTAYTDELARVIAASNSKVPIWSYCEDMVCSAGYWAASQSSQIWAGRNAIVGSIGTYMVIEDSSKAAESVGVEVVVIKAGEHKGDGTPGTPLTEKVRARFQATVDSLNATFVSDVASGRGVELSVAQSWNTGDVWVGASAKDAGLVDAVGTLDEMIQAFSESLSATATNPAATRGAAPSAFKSEETMKSDEEKLGFLATIATAMGLGNLFGPKSEEQAPAEEKPKEELPAPVATATLSAEDQKALELGRAQLAADKAKSEETPPAVAPAEGEEDKGDDAELQRSEAIASYVKGYNQVMGTGKLTVKSATSRLAALSIEQISERTSKLEGSAKAIFGDGTGRVTKAVSGAAPTEETKPKMRQSLISSGLY